MLRVIRNNIKRLDIHTLEVVRKSSASTVVKVTGMGIGLLVSVFLGRTIGAEGLGIINLSNRVINILLVVGLLGMRQVIVKEVAIAHNKKDYIHIGNVMHTAYWINGGITLALSILLIILSPWMANTIFKEPKLQYPLMVAFLVMTPQVFSRIFSSGLVGYRKIWQSNLVEQTLSIVITGVLLGILWLLKREITINIVAICYAIGRVGVTISVGFYWKSLFRLKNKRTIITKQLVATSLPLFASTVSAIIISNADTVFLGSMVTSQDVGLYSVAVKIAFLTSFFLQVTNASVGPKIAALFESGKIEETERMIQRVTLALLILGTIPLLFFGVFGKQILNLWGKEFINAYSILIILAFGQLVNISTGAVSQLLIMTGFHNVNTRITVIFMLINLILNYLLIKHYGLTGAAIANTATVSGMNLTRVIIAKNKTGISTLFFI
ncbi:oligosaccharide flippase family protein [uncultured Draconibacterium sp.]|uniref:oligosaccharide flippase family protein n=1 Tax=uncultured Draconibacterium sp. TaxID=1573823 RepID=UPI0032177B9B